MKTEYRKLKGSQEKFPRNVYCSKSIYKLSKDFIQRMSSQNPTDFLIDDKKLVSFENQTPEMKEVFWTENFFENSIEISKCSPKILNEDMMINCIEVKVAIDIMKTNKASDGMNIKNEFLKIKNKNMYLTISRILNKVIKDQRIFEDELREVRLVGIPKGKDSFRPICITNCMKSIFDSIVLMKLNEWIMEHQIIHKTQIGFMHNQNVYDHIQVIKETIRSSNNNFVAAFIDLRKAYNNVERQILYDKLIIYYNIDETLLMLIQMSIEGNYIKLDNKRRFITKGLPQGNRLSPILFNLFFNDITTEFPECFHENLLLYADDLTMIAYHDTTMNLLLEILNNYCNKNKIEINTSKSKILCSNNFEEKEISINGEELKKTKNFKYLGIYINNKGIESRRNINDCNKIVTLKSIYLRNYLREEKIMNFGIAVTLIKMFILSNVNFYWILALENKRNERDLEAMIKKSFKIVFKLNRRFPSDTLQSLTLTDDFTNQINRIGRKFLERINNLKGSMIYDLVKKSERKKAFIKLKKITSDDLKEKKKLLEYKQLETFGIKLYDRIPFVTEVCKNIANLIEKINKESKEKLEEEIMENKMSEEENIVSEEGRGIEKEEN